MALQGRIPGPRPAPEEPATEDPASLAGVIALLGVSLVVMVFAIFARRPPAPKAAPFEMTDFATGRSGRISRRLVLIALGLVVLWLAVFVAVSQFRPDADGIQSAPMTTTTSAPDRPSEPGPTSRPAEPRSDSFRVLAGATGVLLVMMVAASVVAALRHRAKLPPIVVTGMPAESGAPADQSLAVAAERGLAQVGNLALEPREAIIACYAAMEQALAEAPGAAPQASDTPSEVLARAVGNRTISTASAGTLVELFAEARFSSHTMTEEHRDEAERALRSVLADLRSLRSSS